MGIQLKPLQQGAQRLQGGEQVEAYEERQESPLPLANLAGRLQMPGRSTSPARRKATTPVHPPVPLFPASTRACLCGWQGLAMAQSVQQISASMACRPRWRSHRPGSSSLPDRP